MIYIAYDRDSRVIGIVNAKALALAKAFWQGRGVLPNTVKSLADFTDIDEHPTGVYPLLEVVEKEIYQLRDMNSSTKVLLIK